MITCHGCLNAFTTFAEFADHPCPVYSEHAVMEAESPEGVLHAERPEAKSDIRHEPAMGWFNCPCVECAGKRELALRRGREIMEGKLLEPIVDQMAKVAEHVLDERKRYPVATGCLDYFPDALKAVAECSLVATEQHHPGTPMRWDRSKSPDEANTLLRHFIDRGKIDSDGVRHSAKVAWRALALLQKEIEADAT